MESAGPQRLLELSWHFRVVLEPGLSTPNQLVIGCSNPREGPEPCLGNSLLLRAFWGRTSAGSHQLPTLLLGAGE